MAKLLANIFSSPRTTFAGLWTIVVGPLLIDAVPKVAAYFGGQPGLGWQLLGAALTLVVPFVMPDKKSDPAPAA